MTVICSTCNARNLDDANFCEECGIELIGENIQQVEGLENEEGSTGALSEDSPEVQYDAEQETESDIEVMAEDDLGTGTKDLDAGPAEVPYSVPNLGQVGLAATLTLLEYGQLSETKIPLTSSPVLVGKFDPNQGPVDIDLGNFVGNQYLSRRHAELFFDEGWAVRDLGSTNGVFVRKSGQSNFLPRLQSPYQLEDDDEVAFGNIQFRFRLTRQNQDT